MPDSQSGPLITVGMPIYNEERFLSNALVSLLAQDYANFEVLISDNASTDRTGEIGREAAAADSRIQYTRTDENIGSAANFRRVSDMATGKYFMWAAGHDEWSPDLISASVATLEANAKASIALATSYWIDESGERQDRDTDYPDTRGMGHIRRFLTVFWGNMHPVLSVMRTGYLKETRSMQSFAGADLVLLSDMVLKGDFVQADGAWWHRRDVRTKETHKQRMKRYTGAEFGQAKTALDRKFPMLRLPVALVGTVWRARISLLTRISLLLILVPLMPIRYIVGVRKANRQ